MEIQTLIIQDQLILVLFATFGALLRVYSKWLEASAKVEGLKFDSTFLNYTIVSVLGMFIIFENVDIGLSLGTVALAAMSGYSGQLLTTKAVRTALTPVDPTEEM